MANSRLIVDGVQLDIREEIPINMDFEVADIRNIDKRGSTSSLSVIVKGTPSATKLFNNIYEINSISTNFNPNKKTPAVYYVGENPVIVGSLQLLEVERKWRGQLFEVSYRCYLLGNSADLFIGFRNKLLTELDLSDLDHVYKDVPGNYNPVLGEGYCYPYIDYGLTVGAGGTVPVTSEWNFSYLKPAVFEKVYLDRMFAAAGLTYTSNFFNSEYYKRIITPPTLGGKIKEALVNPTENVFVANRVTQSVGPIKTGVADGQGFRFWNYPEIVLQQIPFNNKVSDPGNIYNATTFTATITTPAYYIFQTTFNIQQRYECGNGPTQVNEMSGQNEFQVSIIKIDATTGVHDVIASKLIQTNLTTTGGPLFLINSVVVVGTEPIQLNAGDRVYSAVFQGVTGYAYFYKNGGQVTNRTPTLRIDTQVGSRFLNKVGGQSDLPINGTVRMNSLIPQGITQFDFFKGIVISENLYIEQDPTNSKNYIIEPRDNFINSLPYLDWTSKLDALRPIRIKPSGDLNIKTFKFRQALDNDYANQTTAKLFKERYGERIFEVNNDFSSSEKIVETIFASTPNVGSAANDIVVPAFYQLNEAGLTTSIDVVIRRLYWQGRIPCQSYTWKNGEGGSVQLTEYSYAGATDHPTNMTLDLGFGIPNQLFYIFSGVYTNNNRYTIQYSRLVNELVDKDSKIVLMWINLTANDLATYSFRRVVFIVDAFYYVNKIIGYDPQKTKPLLVELLWLNSGTFVPTT